MIANRRSLAIAGLFAAWALIAGGAGVASGAEDKVRVLIVDGQNNHNWRAMTPPMKAALEQSGRFTVERGDDARPEVEARGLGRRSIRTSPGMTWC